MWGTLHLFSKSHDPSLTWENTWEMQTEGQSTKQGFPGSSAVKNPLTMQETQVQSLGHEDPMEEEMATHSRILAWRIPQIQEPGGLQSMRSQRVRHNWATEQARYKITYKYSSNISRLWKARKEWATLSQTKETGELCQLKPWGTLHWILVQKEKWKNWKNPDEIWSLVNTCF